MITFEKAYQLTMNCSGEATTSRLPFTESLNRVLAEDIHSDIDMPPFNKSAVDGFACLHEDIENAIKSNEKYVLEIIETIPAGTNPTKSITKGFCARIMTGGMVPSGADCVIMVEDTDLLHDNTIRFTGKHTSTNICFKGEDIHMGDKVLEKGTLIQPQHMAVLASVGAINPLVFDQVKVGVISTGDELVEPDVPPPISKIRNSNAYQLMAQIQKIGAKASYFGIALDTKESLTEKMKASLNENDVTLLTGGVSMGDYDYVPEVLQELGIEILFKSVAIQPGRPTLFGKLNGKFIFGLPGNPVSSFVLFEMLVAPFILQRMGNKTSRPVMALPLGVAFSRHKSSRKAIVPVKIKDGLVYPIEYHGSAHINAYVEAEGMIMLEIGVTQLREGEIVHVRQV